MGSRVSISGGGLTLSATTQVDPSHLSVRVTAGGAAALTARIVRVTPPTGPPVNCSACFTVTPKPTITRLTPAVVLAGTQGAVLQLTGTNFETGATVAMTGSGVAIDSVSGSGSSLTVVVSIDSSAGSGLRRVKVTNPDGGTVMSSGLFRVTPLPSVGSISPRSLGPGATAPLTIRGTGFTFPFTGGTVSLGVGVTVQVASNGTGSLIPAVISVSSTATRGPRDVVVTNPDGGSTTCHGCFLVTAAPVATASPTPVAGIQGALQFLTVTGSGFQSGLRAAFGNGVSVVGTTVPSGTGGTVATVRIRIAATAGLGPRTLVLTNPDGGTSSYPAYLTSTPRRP